MDGLRFCQSPSAQNPLANVTLADLNNGPRLPACPSDAVGPQIAREMDRLPITGPVIREAGKRNARITDRPFHSTPVTTVPGDRDNFAYALYGEGLKRNVDHGFVNEFSRDR